MLPGAGLNGGIGTLPAPGIGGPPLILGGASETREA